MVVWVASEGKGSKQIIEEAVPEEDRYEVVKDRVWLVHAQLSKEQENAENPTLHVRENLSGLKNLRRDSVIATLTAMCGYGDETFVNKLKGVGEELRGGAEPRRGNRRRAERRRKRQGERRNERLGPPVGAGARSPVPERRAEVSPPHRTTTLGSAGGDPQPHKESQAPPRPPPMPARCADRTGLLSEPDDVPPCGATTARSTPRSSSRVTNVRRKS